jgi:hypothetical protein
MRSTAYDPSAVPEWARESTTRIAREQPESLASELLELAETVIADLKKALGKTAGPQGCAEPPEPAPGGEG